jgi:hypothetical protein
MRDEKPDNRQYEITLKKNRRKCEMRTCPKEKGEAGKRDKVHI